MTEKYDAIVVGAGPGGAAAAAFMARNGLSTLLVEKATFPRDKVCGDAISGKSMGVMRRLGIEDQIESLPYTPIRGVTFSSPDGAQLSVPFRTEGLPGFVCKRKIFDEAVFRSAVSAGVEVRQQCEMRRLRTSGGRITGVHLRHEGKSLVIESPIVVGADGAYSTVARELGMNQLSPRHYVAGLRSYYEDVSDLGRSGYIELHFVREVLPGYFWIFALPNGAANVGLGMLSSTVKRRDIRLKPLLDRVIGSERFRDRFRGARRSGPVVGWGLPLGSRSRTMAGDGWMLIGDAASLIDPFTGEGIGNAMLSGMLAAEWAAKAHAATDFSASFLSGYEKAVLGELKREFGLSHMLQRMLRWRGLVDLVIRKASRSDELASAISCMFDDLGERRRLLSPGFYWRVLTA